MTQSSQIIKLGDPIESVPTCLHYDEPYGMVFSFKNYGIDRVFIGGGRTYATSDELGTVMYHIRFENGVYAFDSLASYEHWNKCHKEKFINLESMDERFARNA